MQLLKLARAVDVAIPASGYWVKLNAGKPVEKPELSGNPKDIVAITGSPIEKVLEGKSSPKEPEGKSFLAKQEKLAEDAKTGDASERQLHLEKDTLAFLSELDREKVLAVAARIQLPHENEKMHPNIIAHRKAVSDWQKQSREKEFKGWLKHNMPEPPLLADTISDVSLPRVCRIIDGLIKAMEPLGCSLAQDLTFMVRGEKVTFSVSEAKDEIEHVLTKEENLLMLKYVEEKRRYPSTPTPTIRKHDHLYNGRLTFAIHNQKYFRNGKAYVLEDRLGDIMVQFYEVADVVRREREAREEAERKRLEEQRKKEERIKSYNQEVALTRALINAAKDFDLACKIRAYVSAAEASGEADEAVVKWVDWAKKKADWFDPTVTRRDELLGEREHGKDEKEKQLNDVYSSWRW